MSYRNLRLAIKRLAAFKGTFQACLLLAISCLVVGLTSGYATYRLTHDDNLRYFKYPWKSKWITSPYPDNESACFRKSFSITRVPRAAYMVVGANNFYDLKVNGQHLKQFFRPSLFRTWERDQSLYTGIGYFRRDQLARFYDLKPFLAAGKNVVTFSVQSDEGRPKLGVEVAIFSGDVTRFSSDETWKCSPVAQRNGQVAWDQGTNYFDANWDHAVFAKERPIDVAVDGDKDVFEKPVRGFYMSTESWVTGTSHIFERQIDLHESPEETWLRISSLNPYDLSINGRMVGSTAMLNRYSRPVFTKRGNNDAMDRLAFTNASGEYPKTEISRYADIYLVKDLLHQGSNEVRITVHTHDVKLLQTFPKLYVDGNVLFTDGHSQPIQSDFNWRILSASAGEKATRPRLAATGQILNDVATKLRFRGKFDSGVHSQMTALRIQAAITSGFLGLTLLSAWGLCRKRGSLEGLAMLAALIAAAPGVVGLTFFGFQWIFADSPQNAYMSSPIFWGLLVGAVAAAWLGGLVLAAHDMSKEPVAKELSKPRSFFHRHVPKLLMIALAAGAAVLCLTNYGADNYLADEYVSMLAGQGIIRHGIPIFDATGVVYTRSSLYHYLLAAFMWFGRSDTALAARVLSALWQLATITLVYFFAKEMRGRKAGALAAALCAFSPVMLFYAREVRFYAQFEFFTTLAFFCLWRSVHDPTASKYRAGVLLAFCGAYLSQQFAATVVPSIVVIVSMSGQLKLWFKKPTAYWFGFTVLVVVLDFIAYTKWCQTPLPFVDSESVSLLAFHTDVLEVLPSLLLSNNERTQFLIGSFYLFGLVLTCKGVFHCHEDRINLKKWHWSTFLYLSSFPSIIITTLLSSRPTSRYIVQFAPIVIIVGSCIAVDLIVRLTVWMRSRPQYGSLSRCIVAGTWAMVLGLLFASFRPARTWNSFYRSSNRGLSSAARFVKSHIEPGDKVMFFSPEAAMVEIGHCDYLWRPVLGSIYKYVGKDGALRERNSAALVVDNGDKLERIMAENERLWVVVNTRAVANPSQTYNGAMGDLLKANFVVRYEPTGVEVLLWDKKLNHFHSDDPRYGYDQYNFE